MLLAVGAGAGATLLVTSTVGLLSGAPIGAEDNGDGYRLFCGIGLRPVTADGLAAWKGGVVDAFGVGAPSCGMSVPSSAKVLLRAAALGGDSLSLHTSAWWYAVLVGLVVGLAAWAASATSRRRAAVLLVPVAPLALPAFSRFFVSTYGEPAGLLGALAVACGTAAWAVGSVGPGARSRGRAVALGLVVAGGGIAATAKVAYLPVLGAAGVVLVVALLLGRRDRPAWTARQRGVLVAAAVVVTAAVAAPVAGAMHFQKVIYEGANVHDVVFTMALVELGPEGPAALGLPPEATAITGHGFFNGPPRPTDQWWLAATRERPAALRFEALGALAGDPPALLRTLGVGLQATLRADLPYLAAAPADPARPTATAGDIGWSGGRGPELRAVLADDVRPAWLPSLVTLLALLAAASTPVWRRRAPGAARWALGAGGAAATAVGLVAFALAGDGYFELFKHVWLGAYALLVAGLCLLAALGTAIAGLVQAPPGRASSAGKSPSATWSEVNIGTSTSGEIPRVS